jgi:hypothetical protein
MLYLRLHHGEELDNVDVSIAVLIHLLDHLEDALAMEEYHEVKEPDAKSSSSVRSTLLFLNECRKRLSTGATSRDVFVC